MSLNELIENTKYFSALQDFKLQEVEQETYKQFKVWENESHKVYGTFDKDTKIYTIDFTQYKMVN